jgi:CBS domain containing-hemolysin-like protein
MSLTWSLAAVPLLIGLNAFFVAAEYAVVAARVPQIESLRQRGWKRVAAALERLQSNPANAIGAVQVCITMTNLLLGWIGEPAMSALLKAIFAPLLQLVAPALFEGVSLALSFIVVTLLTVVLSELLPKAMTLRYVEPAAVLTAAPILAIQKAIFPLVWLMTALANAIIRPLGLGRIQQLEKQHVTADELRQLIVQAAAEGALSPREQALVLNSLAIGRRKARAVMVPRIRVAYLDLDRSMDDNRTVMNAYLYSRLPLCDGGMDRIIGVVNTKEFLSAYNAAGDSSVLSLLAQPAVFLPENITLDKLVGVMHEQRTQLVFLVDEYGGVEGIVTLKDVVDELVGEINDLADRLRRGPSVTELPVLQAGQSMTVSGETPIHELARRLNRSGWGGALPVTTVNGLILTRVNRVPGPGEEFDIDGVRLRILASSDRAVRRVEVMAKNTTDFGAMGLS